MKTLTVWASSAPPPSSLDHVVLWSSFLPGDAPPGWFSLPEYVHLNQHKLRSRYRTWLNEVSKRTIDGISILELMAIRSNLSYWWMSIPTHDSLAIDSPAYRVIRLFALASISTEMDFEQVVIVADKPEVAEVLRSWAHSTSKSVTVNLSGASRRRLPSLRCTRGPALAMVRVFWNHLCIAMQPSRRSGRNIGKEGIVFIDYLAHLQEPGSSGAFRSNYWGPLVELLEDWSEPVHWLHISATYAMPAVVRNDVKKCTTFSAVRAQHSVLHSYLDLRIVGRAFRDYLRIRRFGKSVQRQSDIFAEEASGLATFPLLEDLIKDQYFGRTAALNALWISLWETTVANLSTQRLSVYLFENQPWELAFLSAWRRANSNQSLAFAHSTMRFWDLRYFGSDITDDVRGRPRPNTVVVNGPLMKATALGGQYPENFLTIAEATRSYTDMQPQSEPIVDLLILGEYDKVNDLALINVARSIAKSLGRQTKVMYRPHPTAESIPQSIPATWLISDHKSISAAVVSSCITLCGSVSSAALDARRLGKNVVVIGQAEALISSPALGLPNVYLATSLEKASSLAQSLLTKPITILTPDPVYAQQQVPRWRRLLSDGAAQ